MSIIKSIKQVLGLGPAAENHFWDGSVANQLTLKRGTPDAPGTELLKFLNGVLSFPNQEQSLTLNGYIKLPGGVIIQWGYVTGTGIRSVTFPIPFPNGIFTILSGVDGGNAAMSDSTMFSSTTNYVGLSGAQIAPKYNNGTSIGLAGEPVRWIAIGY